MLAAMRRDADDVGRSVRAGRAGLGWGVALSLFVFAVSALVIASGRGGPSEASDQDRYHLVVIDQMSSQWPAIDVVDYPSATSPGYHALMAGIRVALGPESGLLAMRLVNAAVGALVPLWCFVVARRFVSSGRAFALSAPLALNSYVLGGSAYLTTDNAGLLLALVAVGVCVGWPASTGRLLLAGLAGTLAVATRQVHVWAACVPAASYAAAHPALRRVAPGPLRAWTREAPLSGAVPLLSAAAATAAPVALVGVFVWLWGGLVPPAYASLHNSGANLASYALALSLAGVIAPALSLVTTPLWRSSCLRSRLTLGLAVVGIVAAVMTPTTFQMKERALGWLWHGVWIAPAFGDRSLLLAALAPLGGVAVGALACDAARAGHGGRALVLLTAMAGWLSAQSMNTMAWQRYFEPTLLVSLAWLAAMGAARDEWAPVARPRPRYKTLALLERAWWLGPLVLVVLQAAVTGLTLLREVVEAPPARF